MQKIIIEMGEGGADMALNNLKICDCILKDAKDGETVKFEGEGVLIEHEGKRFIAVHKVDGEPVEEMDDMMDDYSMDSEDALDNYMNNKRKK